ncbi:hypothetical protein DFJ63DRAFT_336441 [Scheffersomyces coipomensis]|uniref:uncharacterized protein n=1 Tax=Scheffersomyces coipomensis TaxID=1788519 RepID=UPI00315DED83
MGRKHRQDLFDQLDSIVLDIPDSIDSDNDQVLLSPLENEEQSQHPKQLQHPSIIPSKSWKQGNTKRSISTSSSNSFSSLSSNTSTQSSQLSKHTTATSISSVSNDNFKVRQFQLKSPLETNKLIHHQLTMQQQNLTNILDYLIDMLNYENNQIISELNDSVDNLSNSIPFNTFEIKQFNLKFNERSNHTNK